MTTTTILNKCRTDVAVVQTAIAAYDKTTGGYPPPAADGTAAATENALNSAIGPFLADGKTPNPHQLLHRALTDQSLSIAAGYRYTETGKFAGGSCPA